eukprot:CAMPEP_0176350068 /NCGR_PEP_ID=MMETSP0126-20121128/9179_1 /TAXON_ID=141414 ORGANISM="Strombidinopsis acuminatum, Strain SPMC142" /NCGR_SAMPLE_ID=MMETSP0126 /ASSEMBLY_ACC=CAM_ASM_000229 /LENGTH=44 /DNA_ID= /DNA_START= /DNA_END= /DNA_ORIENTATION=
MKLMTQKMSNKQGGFNVDQLSDYAKNELLMQFLGSKDKNDYQMH